MHSLVTVLALLLPSTVAADGFMKHTITAITKPGPGLLKRQDALPLSNVLTGTLYTIQLSIGTPPQPLTLVIDTGSSELWVNPTCSAAPAPEVQLCNSFPQFDYKASSTFNDTGSSFQLPYGKGTANVEYVTDTIVIGCKYSLQHRRVRPLAHCNGYPAATIHDQIFGYNVESSQIPFGILGLAPYLQSPYPQHDFVLDSLVSQGQINSRAFSLDLRSVDSPDGTSCHLAGCPTLRRH
jgi:hypothetical protein